MGSKRGVETGGAGEPVQRAAAWLRSRANGGRWLGEPIVEYWIEHGGQRTFFQTVDRGAVTSAWAGLALRAAEASRRE